MPETASHSWQNRIVGHAEIAPDQLLAHFANPKIHPDTQTQALKGILGELGWIDSVKVSVDSGRVIDGHDRVKAALQANQPTVPVTYIQLTDAEELYALSTFDPVGALAATDAALLADLLAEVTSGDAAVAALLDGLAGAAPVDAAALWQGMPDFENEAQAARSLHVHFLTDADCAAFCDVLGITVTEQTKTVWYPAPPDRPQYRFESDAA